MPRKPRTAVVPANTTSPSLQQSLRAEDHVYKGELPSAQRPLPSAALGLNVVLLRNLTQNPPGKIADVELHFTAGPLTGLKLIGFALWQRVHNERHPVYTTFPARQYSVNGERRSFALLRPCGGDTHAQDRVADLIINAWLDFERHLTVCSPTEAAVLDKWTVEL